MFYMVKADDRKDQAQQAQRIGNVQRHIHKMVTARASAEQRDVGHVADPGQRHPYGAMAHVAEGLAHIGPRKAVLDERTGKRVVGIVESQKTKTDRLSVDGEKGQD